MKIQRINSYTKHGCGIHGNLALVEYEEDMNRDPQASVFGSMICYDYIDKAKEMLSAEFESFTVALAIPDLVVRIVEIEPTPYLDEDHATAGGTYRVNDEVEMY